MTGQCNLCGKKKDLQRVCHVIPEFLYEKGTLFHHDHNLMGIDLKTYFKTGERKLITYKQKTGEFDQYKLCFDCDGKIIGNYESYASEFFFSDSLPKGKELNLSDNKGCLECLNTDYKKLKLFFLSILWKAAISDRPIFSEIVLSDKEREVIGEMLLEGIPKRDIEYPVYFMNTLFDNSISNDFLVQPISLNYS